MPAIRKVAVIGSGVMGSGIAAQAANAGLEVILLDIVANEGADRNSVAAGAVQRMRKTNPAPLMHPRNAARIRPGNLKDHLDWLSDCDLVIEVVLENLEIKRDLYRKIDAHRRADCIVTSNTSTIPLDHLVADMPEGFRPVSYTHLTLPTKA